MSFLIHKQGDRDDVGDAFPAEDIENFKWLFDKEDLTHFSALYSYDKHALLKAKLAEMGGVQGLAFALHTNLTDGLHQDDLTDKAMKVRVDKFGKNEIAKKPPRSFFQLMWDALQDFMLLILIICGAINIPLGLTEDPHHGWIDGGAVLLAVVIVVVVTAINDWQKQQQFRSMEDKSADRVIRLFRQRALIEVQHNKVVVGDVVNIQQGDLIPCDGIVFRTMGECKVTEAALTGETDALKKNAKENPFVVKGSQCVGGECNILVTGVGEATVYGKLMSGLLGNRKKQREAERAGVEYDEETAETGESCCPLICPNEDAEDDRTPLQVKLDVLAGQIGYVGTICAAALFEILLLKHYAAENIDFFWESFGYSCIALAASVIFFGLKLKGYLEPYCSGANKEDEEADEEEGNPDYPQIDDPFEDPYVLAVIAILSIWFLTWNIILLEHSWTNECMEYFILAVTVIVVAVPEGLPLAVTVSLAYSMGKMYDDNNFVRKLAACETMGNATTICSDKTGTLTTNMMSVVRCFTGGHLVTDEHLKETNNNLGRIIGDDLARLIGVSIAVNSKATKQKQVDPNNPPLDPDEKRKWEIQVKKQEVLGILLQGETNQTESACLLFTMKKLAEEDMYLEARQSYPVTKVYPFNSSIKMSSIFVKHSKDTYRLYIKGAAEKIVEASTYQAMSGGGNDMNDCKVVDYATEEKQATVDVMQKFTSNGLRCLGLGYREIKPEDIEWVKNPDNNEMEPSADWQIDEDIIFLGIVGIKDPVRDEVPDAVKSCQSAGIVVRMVTGDHLDTAKHIAKECGILTNASQGCMTGEEFRRMLDTKKEGEEKQAIMENLRVVARSRPDDKEAMVEWYKNYHNDVVSVTGDGANDALALQEAHVGLAMNIQGTDVAKEASDIIIMDDNFASIVKTVKWGRSVYDNIRKFVQFQLTVNAVALTLSLIAAFLSGLERPLTAVQLLWVNLIMDTLAALALATEMPTDSLLERRPYSRDTHLISYSMWRFVFVHAFFQLIILMVLLTQGEDFLDLKADSNFTEDRNDTLMCIVFNTFVWMQIFNEINARKVNGEWNVFDGFFDNSLFSGILLLTIVLQVLIVEFGGDFTNTVPLSMTQWAFCVVVGTVSFPIAQLTLWFPVDMEQGMVDVDDEWFYKDPEFIEGHSQSGGISDPTSVQFKNRA